MTKSTEEEEAAERLLFKALCTACSNTQATSSAERLQEEKALEISSLFNGSLDTLQKAKAIQETEGRILIDHTDYAYKVLSEVRGTAKNDRTVYIILSGAGYELVTDLILASFLIISQLATKVILQARAVPFGKFCTLNDYQNLLLFLQTSPQPEQADLQWLHDHLTSLQAEGKLEVRSHNAWHLLTSYWHLPKQYPSLYQECQKAALVILKGDFHYRKLTCDVSSPLPLKPIILSALLHETTATSRLTFNSLALGPLGSRQTLQRRLWFIRQRFRYPDTSTTTHSVRCAGWVREGQE